MMFARRLREGVRRGEITCSVRIWMYPRVKVGNRYAMEEGLPAARNGHLRRPGRRGEP